MVLRSYSAPYALIARIAGRYEHDTVFQPKRARVQPTNCTRKYYLHQCEILPAPMPQRNVLPAPVKNILQSTCESKVFCTFISVPDNIYLLPAPMETKTTCKKDSSVFVVIATSEALRPRGPRWRRHLHAKPVDPTEKYPTVVALKVIIRTTDQIDHTGHDLAIPRQIYLYSRLAHVAGWDPCIICMSYSSTCFLAWICPVRQIDHTTVGEA